MNDRQKLKALKPFVDLEELLDHWDRAQFCKYRDANVVYLRKECKWAVEWEFLGIPYRTIDDDRDTAIDMARKMPILKQGKARKTT